MSKSLEVSLERAQPELMTAVHIASLGFAREESKELALDVENHLVSGKIVYRIFVNNCEAGFAIFATYGDILYLSGIIIIPKFQGQGVIRYVFDEVRATHPECQYLALRTQSLRMYLAAKKLCVECYPSLGKLSVVPKAYAKRGKLIAKKIQSQFPIHVGFYGGPLYGEKPVYGNPELQKEWDELCNFERGDAIIFVGSLA